MPEDLVRISVGLEDVDDILWDLDQALDRRGGRPSERHERVSRRTGDFDASEFASPEYDAPRAPVGTPDAGETETEPPSDRDRNAPGRPSAPERLNLLRQAKSIAIVGASDKPVARQLLRGHLPAVLHPRTRSTS